MRKTIYILSRNWFRLITGISMLLFSAGFFIRSVIPAQALPDLRMEAGQRSGKYTYWVVASEGYAYIFQAYDGASPTYQRKTKLQMP
jgi:hypothetical protein